MKPKNLLWIALALAVIAIVCVVKFVRTPVKQKAFAQTSASVQSPPASSIASVRPTIAAPNAAPRPATILFKDSESKILEYYADSFRAMLQFRGASLALTGRQIDKLAAIYADIGLKREAIEAGIEKADRASSTRTVLAIPAYLDQGQELKQELYSRFESVLGQADGEKLIRALDSSLALDNRAWGEAEQSIVITHEPDGMYSFEHGVEEHSIAAWVRNALTGKDIQLTATNMATARLPKTDLGQYAAKAKYLPQG